MVWRAPTVLKITDYSLSNVTRALLQSLNTIHLIVVDTDSKLEKLKNLGDDINYAAVIQPDKNIGRNYLLAYQETVQAASLDIPREVTDRFELI